MRMHTQEKTECPRSPHTSLSSDESATVQIHLEFNFNVTRKHFCHIFFSENCGFPVIPQRKGNAYLFT